MPADETKTYSATEHAAILDAEVARETAELRATTEDLKAEHAAQTETLQAEKAEALNRVDVLEAEKSAAETARDAAVQELAEYKTSQERAAELETLKVARTDAVKAALEGIEESYFTEARVARWAEMSAEAWDIVLEDLKETAAAAKKNPFMKDEDEDDKKEKARETAAFKGDGAEPTSEGKESSLGTLFSLNRNRKIV